VIKSQPPLFLIGSKNAPKPRHTVPQSPTSWKLKRLYSQRDARIMSDTPLCQILIPAPWQKKKTMWGRDDHTTEEISVEELASLVWSIEESQTPLSEISEEIASTMETEE